MARKFLILTLMDLIFTANRMNNIFSDQEFSFLSSTASEMKISFRGSIDLLKRFEIFFGS